MKNTKKRFALILSLIMAVSMAMTACSLSDDDDDDDEEEETPKYEQPIENYFKAMEKGDGKLLKKCMGSAYIKYMEESFSNDEEFDIDEYIDNNAKSLKKNAENKYGENIKITYSIKDKQRFDDDDIDEWEKEVKNMYDEKVEITSGYDLEIKAKIKGDDDSEEDEMSAVVANVDGSWCILDIN